MTTSDLAKLGYTVVDGKAVKLSEVKTILPAPAKRSVRTVKRFVHAPVVSEANRSEHWAKKYPRKKLQRMAVCEAFGAELLGRGQPKSVLFVLLSAQELDSDNLRSATKQHRDQIARSCGFDDRADVWRYGQRKPYPYECRGLWIVVKW